MTTPFEERPAALRTGNYVPLRFEASSEALLEARKGWSSSEAVLIRRFHARRICAIS